MSNSFRVYLGTRGFRVFFDLLFAFAGLFVFAAGLLLYGSALHNVDLTFNALQLHDDLVVGGWASGDDFESFPYLKFDRWRDVTGYDGNGVVTVNLVENYVGTMNRLWFVVPWIILGGFMMVLMGLLDLYYLAGMKGKGKRF